MFDVVHYVRGLNLVNLVHPDFEEVEELVNSLGVCLPGVVREFLKNLV